MTGERWEVIALEEAVEMPPELEGIAGDYGHASESFSLSRRGHPGDVINLSGGRIAALTRSGVRYELEPTTEPNVYVVLVNGTAHKVRIYYYCQGPRPVMPQNARSMACPFMLSEKVACSFSCDTGFELSEPSLHVGSLACTASGKFTANSSCVRVAAERSSAPSSSVPSIAPMPEDSSKQSAPKEKVDAPSAATEAPKQSSRAWIAVLIVGAVAMALFFLVTRRRR